MGRMLFLAARLVKPFSAASVRWLAAAAAPAGTRIGIVGMGNIGSAIARNLLDGGLVPAAFTDLSATAGAFLQERGAQRVASPREVAEACDVVITALTTPAVVRGCVLGDAGILTGLRHGGCWIDHSTTDYNQTLELNSLAQQKGIDVLEAPITGGLALLQEKKMTTFVGGDKSVFQAQLPILSHSFANILYMGKMGSATITKVITNMFAALHVVAMGEALVVAKKAGIDFDSYFDAVRLSAGSSFVWETEAPLVFNQTFEPGFTLDLHCKDLNLGYEIARQHGAPLELFGLVEQHYRKAMIRYGGHVGSTSPAKLNQDALGVSLAAPGWKDWSYTTEMVPSQMPGRAPTMAVVHKVDQKAAAERRAIMAHTGSDQVHRPTDG